MKTCESTLFEKSRPGRRGTMPPETDCPKVQPEELLPAAMLRQAPPTLPELSELDVLRHFTRLSQLNFSVDTHFYPLGSCTMKYNPRVNVPDSRPSIPSNPSRRCRGRWP